MLTKFNEIKKEYDQFYNELLSKGQLVQRDTDRGYWGASVTDEVFELFNKLDLSKYKHFLDMGSGDGKVAFIASLFTNSTGIEYDKELHLKGLEIKNKLDLNTELIKGDFFNHDFSKYDIIYLYSDKPFYRDIEKKMIKELKGILVVYGSHYMPTVLKRKKVLDINGTLVSVYKKK